jgi:hypothetical protein
MGICSIFLLRWAYKAFNGDQGQEVILEMPERINNIRWISWVYSVEKEEDKSRILASLLPWIGIYISEKYKNPLMQQGRVIGSFFTSIIILSFLLSGTESFLTFVLTAIYIVVFVVEGVYLFIYGRFISWNIFEYIPSYSEIEAHFVASFHSLIEFLRVVFGKEKNGNYRTYLEEARKSSWDMWKNEAYFMPAWLIGIPWCNIFCIPSLFIRKYASYRTLIIQGLLITGFMGYAYFIGWSYGSVLGLFLLFPIVHIVTFASSDVHTRAPIIGMWMRIWDSYSTLKNHVEELQVKKEETKFVYATDENTSQQNSPQKNTSEEIQ